MKLNIIPHVLLFVFIIGVIGVDRISGFKDDGTIINGQNVTDLPAIHVVTTTTTPEEPTTLEPTTTTTAITTEKPTTTTTISTTSSTSTTTFAPANTTTTSTTGQPITTVSTTTESTTAAVPTLAPSPSHKGRRFDGPSFLGGIILASGLMAIGFVSWKFYKARTERNYHTL